MQREIARFVAVDEEGTAYTVVERQDVLDAGTQSNPNAKILGLKSYTLAEGGALNYVDGNTFKIVQTGVLVRRASAG